MRLYCARCQKNHTRGGVFVGPLGSQCPECLAFLEHRRLELWTLLFDFAVIVALGLALAVIVLLLAKRGVPL